MDSDVEAFSNARATAARLLLEATERLEHRARQAPLNEYTVRDLVEIVGVLGDSTLLQRARALIPSAPRHADAPGSELPTLSLTELLGSLDRLASANPLVSLARSENWREALARAGSVLEIENVASTRAILGAFDDAVEVAVHSRLEPFRRIAIYEVGFIEAHRRSDSAWCKKFWERLKAEDFNRLLVAIGLLGRRPFAGYPYPDW